MELAPEIMMKALQQHLLEPIQKEHLKEVEVAFKVVP